MGYLRFGGILIYASLALPNVTPHYVNSVKNSKVYKCFSDFTFFLSVLFLVTTTLILKFKEEKRDEDIEIDLTKVETNRHANVKETYMHLWRILKIRIIQMMITFILTWHVSFHYYIIRSAVLEFLWQCPLINNENLVVWVTKEDFFKTIILFYF